MAVIYSATCAQCGSDLVLDNAELDTDNDLSVSFQPCKQCIDDAVAEVEEAHSDVVSDLEIAIANLKDENEELQQQLED